MSSEPKQQALPVGYRLEEYEIQKELGSGGFGITYLARDVNLEREVVIKENLPLFAFRDTSTSTVHPRSQVGEDSELFEWSLENFTREARTLAKFDHPNIVKVLRVFRGNGTAYFVMPYVAGESLDQVIAARMERGESLSGEDLEALLLPLLDALEELHAESIYHRDIKPGNVLVTEPGHPVLIDFGAARQRISEKSMTVVESPGYTPFEQLQSQGNVGPWSDLYGLAGTFYKAITGETPPKANDRVKKDPIRKLAEEGDLAERFGATMLGALDRALAFDEEDRPQTAEEMRELLESGEEEKKEPLLAEGPENSPSREDISESPWPARRSLPLPRFREEPERKTRERPETSTSGRKRKENVILFVSGFLAVAIVGWLIFGMGSSQPGSNSVIGESATGPPGKGRETIGSKVVSSGDGSGAFAPATEATKGSREGKTSTGSSSKGRGMDPRDESAVEDPGTKAKPPGELAAEEPGEPGGMAGTKAGEVREFVGIQMVWCPPGEFLMGSPESEEGRFDSETQHVVQLTKGFWLAKTECTQGQWERVMGSNPSRFEGSSELPVEQVSWEDIQGWLAKMNEKDLLSAGWKWELPTEAQWEFACRAGTKGAYGGSGDLSEMGWYADNSGNKTHEAGTKRANDWGLQDMHGNVYEWCRDWYGEYPSGTVSDPTGAETGGYRVYRGGSWSDAALGCRSAYRRGYGPDRRLLNLGFRPALVPSR